MCCRMTVLISFFKERGIEPVEQLGPREVVAQSVPYPSHAKGCHPGEPERRGLPFPLLVLLWCQRSVPPHLLSGTHLYSSLLHHPTNHSR